MKKIFLIMTLLIITLLSPNIFAEPPIAEPWNNLNGLKITKVGFYSGNINDLNVEHPTNIADSAFFKIVEISPAWFYISYDQQNTPPSITVGPITDIETGEYYVFLFIAENWLYSSNAWMNLNMSLWASPMPSYNGTAVSDFSGSTVTYTLDKNNYLKATVTKDGNVTINTICTSASINGSSSTVVFNVSISQ
jgi:hypothetical protein